MQRRRFLTCSSALAGAGLAPATTMARRLFPADVTDRYVAWQGERAVGRQEISFTREPGRFVVDVKIQTRLTTRGIGDVSYAHESREVWETGWLHALESKTQLDGRDQEVHAERRYGALMVSRSNGGPFQMSTYIVPSSLWHRDSRLVDAFIDVEDGSIRFVQPRYVGKEILRQGGGSVEAHRYTLRGQMNREAWYDANCVLVGWDMPLTTGGWINFRRQMS